MNIQKNKIAFILNNMKKMLEASDDSVIEEVYNDMLTCVLEGLSFSEEPFLESEEEVPLEHETLSLVEYENLVKVSNE